MLPTIIAGDFSAAPDAASVRFLSGLQSLAGHSVYYHDAWSVSVPGQRIRRRAVPSASPHSRSINLARGSGSAIISGSLSISRSAETLEKGQSVIETVGAGRSPWSLGDSK